MVPLVVKRTLKRPDGFPAQKRSILQDACPEKAMGFIPSGIKLFFQSMIYGQHFLL
jgi:hypothetical protein